MVAVSKSCAIGNHWACAHYETQPTLQTLQILRRPWLAEFISVIPRAITHAHPFTHAIHLYPSMSMCITRLNRNSTFSISIFKEAQWSSSCLSGSIPQKTYTTVLPESSRMRNLLSFPVPHAWDCNQLAHIKDKRKANWLVDLASKNLLLFLIYYRMPGLHKFQLHPKE